MGNENLKTKQNPPLCTLAYGVLKCFRNSRPEVLFEKGVLKNFGKLTGKHLCRSVFFNKVAGLTPISKNQHIIWTKMSDNY